MSNFVSVETFDRRALIRGLAIALTAVGSMDLDAAQQVHTETAAEKARGNYKVKAFEPNEFKTLERLAELIVPKDEKSGSARDAGAPEFIDTLSSQNEKLADIFHGGLAWLDSEMRKRYQTTFVGAKPAQQTEMLDVLVAAERAEAARRGEELVYQKSSLYKDFSGYTVQRANELGPGIVFFDWVRKMTVDAFYTSPIGVKDLNYLGNRAYSKYTVPQESMDYAMKRSPFA
ncbi:gluconate 2-dehydrogenase subunit 3 family protein [Bryobacter aggregatus]|uniref:gluconate 2-dehydrogenase subunit 3 family protein n=1 Tax=Bryobacter aggregatus TaxID=360054 RepID=UPI0004E0FF1A|nr:gluconate 2-dehydrogenase subunit 3 family protein [Bryobacter aggregatus]